MHLHDCIYLMSHLKFMMIYKPYSLIYIDKGIFSEGYTCSTTWKLIVTLSWTGKINYISSHADFPWVNRYFVSSEMLCLTVA